VSDNATSDIVVYSLAGTELGRLKTGATSIMGLTFGADGKLWFVDRGAETVVRIDP
jgi:hypothetical protein